MLPALLAACALIAGQHAADRQALPAGSFQVASLLLTGAGSAGGSGSSCDAGTLDFSQTCASAHIATLF